MLIVMDNETLYRNISNDGKKGSGAGDIILNQNANAPKPTEYKISDFNCIPENNEFLNHPSLISVKSSDNCEIYKVFIFDKFKVNGVEIECENRFIIFIRKAGSVPKIRLICQGSKRSINGTNINNKLVLDSVSKYLNNEAFTVQALEYNEEDDSLNFIVFLYGKYNQASQIFKKSIGIKRRLVGYNENYLEDWSDVEFSLHYIHLIRKYNLNILTILLNDKMYCSKRFKMNFAFLDKNNSADRFNQKINIFNEDFYIPINLSKISKIALWDFLLDRIEIISEDVINELNEYELKPMRIPNIVAIDSMSDTIEIPFKIEESNYKRYFYEQEIYQGDNVILVSDEIDSIKSSYLYKIRFVKEESIICDKCKIMINPQYELEILKELRGNL